MTENTASRHSLIMPYHGARLDTISSALTWTQVLRLYIGALQSISKASGLVLGPGDSQNWFRAALAAVQRWEYTSHLEAAWATAVPIGEKRCCIRAVGIRHWLADQPRVIGPALAGTFSGSWGARSGDVKRGSTMSTRRPVRTLSGPPPH